MPTIPWNVVPVTLADSPSIARNNVSAFWQDPNWRLLWPSQITESFLIESVTHRTPRNLLQDRARRRHIKAVDPETGELVGYARWILPGNMTGEWLEAQVLDIETDEEREQIEQKAKNAWWEPKNLEGMDDLNVAVMERILRAGVYLQLDYLAVHPDHKGKGVATALVTSGIEQAQKLAIDAFILAYKASLNLYKRLGFEEVERVIQDAARWGGDGEYGAYFLVYRSGKKERRAAVE